jgi:hypothetical protein
MFPDILILVVVKNGVEAELAAMQLDRIGFGHFDQ